MQADTVENVRRLQALGHPRAAEAMEERLQRQRETERQKEVPREACRAHEGTGFQKDCAWCRGDAP